MKAMKFLGNGWILFIMGLLILCLILLEISKTSAHADDDAKYCAHQASIMRQNAECVQKNRGDFYSREGRMCIEEIIKFVESDKCVVLRQKYSPMIPRIREDLRKMK